MKKAIFVCATAIELKCPVPDCGDFCVNLENGSSMIEEHHKKVECNSCGEKLEVPQEPFSRIKPV